ncbi:MAG: hypothetical protein ACE5DY_05425 [Mariprofundaceae bacterium]
MKPKQIFLFAALLLTACGDNNINIPSEEAHHIGELIFQNECAGKEACLTSWNKGEEFASLGIGHFIWYPQGYSGPFEESFPKLLRYMYEKGVQLPDWLAFESDADPPWQTRQAFMAAQKSLKMIELRHFLAETKSFQAEFLVNRLKTALPKMLDSAPEPSRAHIRTQFYRLANSTMGSYVLVDYVNFKGEGVKPDERYHGKGWGLLQVLEHMRGKATGDVVLQEFAKAASFILTRRVQLSPPARNEQRWLAGWKKRVNTYNSITLSEIHQKPS